MPRSSPIHQLLKPRRTREKTGCLPCRRRRKKCDELKPICSGCKRNHLICSLNSDSRAHSTSSYRECYIDSMPSMDKTPSNLSALGKTIPKMKGPSKEAQSHEIGLSLKQSSETRPPKFDQEAIQKMISTVPNQLRLSDMFGSFNLRHPASRILLEHYIHVTSNLLSINRGPQNPFITCVMPLAHSDSMIMDSVLALSGGHLCYAMPRADIESISLTHYNLVLRQLKFELTQVDSGKPSDPVRVLLAILLLSITESISGNSQGAIFHHLRASSHFVESVLTLDPNHGDQEVRAFVLETYAYMVSVANITTNAQPTFPSLILDPCISGLERLQGCKAFGMMFGYARDLLSLVPSICTLGYNRILEENAGGYSFDSMTCYKALQSKIENWQEPSIGENCETDTNDLRNAAKVYKEAVLIFLHTAFYASNVTDTELLALIDKSLYAALSLIVFDTNSPVLSVMLWPCMIIGSCLRQPSQREYLRYKMLEVPFNMTIVLSSIQLLDWLWEDSSSGTYGPHGLGSIMRKHGVIHSMS